MADVTKPQATESAELKAEELAKFIRRHHRYYTLEQLEPGTDSKFGVNDSRLASNPPSHPFIGTRQECRHWVRVEVAAAIIREFENRRTLAVAPVPEAFAALFRKWCDDEDSCIDVCFILDLFEASGYCEWRLPEGAESEDEQELYLRCDLPTAAPAPATEGEWVLVPKVPTPEMLESALEESGQRISAYPATVESGVIVEQGLTEEEAADFNRQFKDGHAEVWAAMIAAAPQPARKE